MSARRPARGVALLIAIIVVLVVTVLAVGVIRYASREVAGATAGRKEAAIASCAEGARSMLLSQWKLLGQQASGSISPLNVTLEPSTPTALRGGHYGDVNVTGVQIVKMNDLTVGDRLSVSDLTNRIAESVANYRVVVHCTQGTGLAARELEVEFGINFGL
jgi:hypothetical protein